ncbi:hypothetical protein COOONC_19423 [Cooperia oncophora]
MYWLIFFLLPYAELPGKITEEENERLKANCGAHYLGESGTVEKSMPGHEVPVNKYPWITSLVIRAGKTEGYCTGCANLQSTYFDGCSLRCGQKPAEEYEKICNEVDRLLKEGHHLTNWASLEELARQAYDKVVSPERLTFRASSSCKHLQQCNYDNIKFTTYKTSVSYNNMGDPDVLEEIHIDSRNVKQFNPELVATLFGKSMCPGDSGGPLVQINRENRFSVVGVMSGIWTNCSVSLTEQHKRHNFFVDVRRYVDWICTNTGICPLKKMGSHADSPSEWIRFLSTFGRH